MRTAKILSILFTLLFSVFAGTGLSMVTGLPIEVTASVLFGLSALPIMPNGVAAMGLLREMWTGEIIKKFRHDGTWLGRVIRRDDLVVNNTIHLVDIGADPDVLVNNTTYPIPSNLREDTDAPIGLDKFDTENTRIPDDELQGLPYDKKGSVAEQHTEALIEKTMDKAAHSMAPTTAADGIIVMTTGGTNGASAARKRLLPANLIQAKKKADLAKWPKGSRVLVLCPDHVEDLLMVDEVFEKQYKNMKTGEILNLYGWDIYEYANNPVYYDNSGTLTKRAFGAAADATNDQASSFFFTEKRAMQFAGDIKIYNSDAQNNPETRESTLGLRQYHMCLPVKSDGIGAIVSDKYTG